MNVGDVVLVDFPFDDASAFKQRPVLVLALVPPGPNEDAVVLMLTSSARRLTNLLAGDVAVNDLAVAPLASVIRCRKMYTTRKTYLGNKLGSAGPTLLTQIRAEVKSLLAL